MAEFDDNGDMQRWFIYGNFIDEPLVMIDSDEDQYYYAHNHLFSTVALIDENGDVIERYEYNAYGMPMIYNAAFTQNYGTSQYDNPYLFTSRRVDSFDSDDLKLQYNRNRYYDYYTGCWLSQDPKGYVDGMNLYEYVAGNPISFLDPWGLWRIHRRNAYRAIAVSQKGDTIRKLARKIKLEPEEFPLWMRGKVKIQGEDGLIWYVHNFPSSSTDDEILDTEICPGSIVTIPNIVIIIYGNDVADSWWPTSTFSMIAARLDNKSFSYKSQKYYVIEVKYPPSTQELSSFFRLKDLHGLIFGGHGTEGAPGGIVARNDEMEISLIPGKYVHHRLAFLELYACSSAVASDYQRMFDPASVGGRTDVSEWEVNVSSLGYFIGFDGDVNGFNIWFKEKKVKGGAEYAN